MRINESRKELQQLLTMAEHREFQRLLIEYLDRLARFGYRYLERHLNSHGVTIESTQVHAPKTSSEELTEDLLTMITVFSARLYGKRSKEKMSRHGRKNHKRAYWLRGQIVQWERDLAFREGILTVERNPAYTSQMCPHCQQEHRHVGTRVKHTFTCSNPDHSYVADADFVGMMNLYRKWSATFTYPSQKKKDEPKPVQATA